MGGETNEVAVAVTVAPFDPTKKKKKKKVNLTDLVDENSTLSDSLIGVQEEVRNDEHGETSEVTEQYYLYEELLGRVFGVVDIRTKTTFKLPVPEVLRQGTKKTVLVNFLEFCKMMRRSPEHLQAYVEAELASNSAVDGKYQLVINGRFQVKHLESILRRYGSEYVICHGCKSRNTILAKENRLMFLRCEECGSARTVAPIKRGFEAQIRRNKNAR